MRITQKFLQDLTKIEDTYAWILNQGLNEDDLVRLLKRLDSDYYNGQNNAVMPDSVYDRLKETFTNKYPTNPYVKQIGAPVKGAKNKVVLPVYMGSLDKVKKDDGDALMAFVKRATSSILQISDKLDGVSALLVCTPSQPIKMYSRGNGSVGQDITHLIPSLANRITTNDDSVRSLIIRGELIISKHDFTKVSHLGANARNMVSGFVNSKTARPELKGLVQFRAYSVIEPAGMQLGDQYKLVKKLGLQLVHAQSIPKTVVSIQRLQDVLGKRKQDSEFEIDGIVVSDNDWYPVETDRNPTRAFAFKDEATFEKAKVKVIGVEWNISKGGYMKPVVLVEPTRLAGVTIGRATGFNAAFIESNKIGPNAEVLLTRSGDVIPYIVQVLKPAPKGPAMPDVAYTWNKTHVDIVVVDTTAVELKQLQYFFDIIDVAGFSGKSVAKLYEAGYKTIHDILKMKPSDIVNVEGLKTKVDLVDNIKSKIAKVPCLELMVASNCFGHGLGSKKLQSILKVFPDAVSKAPTSSQLLTVSGVSTTTANLFLAGMSKFRDFLRLSKLENCRFSQQTSLYVAAQLFANQVMVFTGFRDKELEGQLVSMGARVSSSVTGKTTMLIVKDKDATSSKIKAALEKGIKVVTLEQIHEQIKKNNCEYKDIIV